MRYIEFLEEQRARDERNHKLLGALDKVDSSLALMTAKTDRLSILRKQYEAYLLRVYANRCPTGTGDSGVASQNDERPSKKDIPQVNRTAQSINQSVEMSRVTVPTVNLSRTSFQQSQTVPAEYTETRYMGPSGVSQYGQISQANSQVNLPYEQIQFSQRQQVPFAYETSVMEGQGSTRQQYSPYAVRTAQVAGSPESVSEFNPQKVQYGRFAPSSQPVLSQHQITEITARLPQIEPEQSVSRYLSASVPHVPIDRNIPQVVTSRAPEVVEPSGGNVTEFLPSMTLQDHQRDPERHFMPSQLVPGSGDLQNALTGDTSFNLHRQSTPLPSYLDYSIRYTRDEPKVEEETRSMTKSDLEDLIKRNERILPKNYPSRNERPKATGRTSKFSSIINKNSVISDGRSTKALESELDNYISKIRTLHRDLDQQSLEELDHEQNTSGDLLNVTLSDDGPDLPVEEKSRENQVPEQVQEVLALADDLASSTANIDDVLVGPTNEKRQTVGESPKGMSSAETNVKKEDSGYQVTLTNMTVNETGNQALRIKDSACAALATLAADGIRAKVATSELEIASPHKNIRKLATPHVENSSVNVGVTIPSKQSDEIKKDQLKAVHEIPVDLAAELGKVKLDERQDTLDESKSSVLLEDIEGKGVQLLDEKPKIGMKVLGVEKEVEPTSLQHFEKNIQEVEQEEKKDFVTEKDVRDDTGNEVLQSALERQGMLSRAGSVAEKIGKNIPEERSFEDKKIKTKSTIQDIDNDFKDQESYLDLREPQQSSEILKGDDYDNLNIKDKKNIPLEHVSGLEPKTNKQMERHRDEDYENFDEAPRNYALHPTETLEYGHPDYDSSKTEVFREKEYPSYDFKSREGLEQPIEYSPIEQIGKSNEVREPDSDYEHHMEQPYKHGPNEVYSENPDQQYPYDMGEQYIDETNQRYKYDPNVQYEHNPTEEYEQYIPDSKAQYEQYPGEHYSEYEHNPNEQYESDPNQEYEHDLGQQYEQGPNQQYEQDPNQEYEQDPNQQYAHDLHQQYEPDPHEQYEHYEQDPSPHYNLNQQYDSGQPYNPDQHYPYPTEGYEDQEQYEPEEHNQNEFVNNESYNPDEQVYFEQSAQPYPVEEQDHTAAPKNTEYNPDQSQPYEEGYKGVEELLEDPVVQGIESAVSEPKEDVLRLEDKERIDREQKVEGQVEDKKKKKDVIKSLLDSDTDSTIERNVSNTTESDFDFN
ncbi:uncharacterized protein LOC107274711 isoform X2 [Cephus cinctus]|nr:uncharacterized protein LOC107274711 isoform X2 [Cephus cinctus]